MADAEERPAKLRRIESPVRVDTKSLDADIIKQGPSQDGTTMADFGEIGSQDGLDLSGEKEQSSTPTVQTIQEDDGLKAMSKSQLKKLRKREEFEAGREDRKARRKEKVAEKKARKRQEKDAAPPTLGEPSSTTAAPRPRRPIQVPVSFLIDCSFDEYMTERELVSLGSQITRCYHHNRTARFRSHLGVSSWGGRLRERFDGLLAASYRGWKGVRFEEETWLDMAGNMDAVMRGPQAGILAGALKPPSQDESSQSNETELATSDTLGDSVVTDIGNVQAETASEAKAATESMPSESPSPRPPVKIVYLSSDSPNTLTHLQPNTSYIIGGIVDKNRHKGLCYKQASSTSASHATLADGTPVEVTTGRLPISQYMSMQSRSVLTVNHVVEIMLKWLETGDWGEAFLSVIPKRKGGVLKNGNAKDTAEAASATSNVEEDVDLDDQGEEPLDVLDHVDDTIGDPA